MTKNYLVEFYYHCTATESDYDNSNFQSCFKNSQFWLCSFPKHSLFSSYKSALAYVQCELEPILEGCDISLDNILSETSSSSRFYNSAYFFVAITIKELTIND